MNILYYINWRIKRIIVYDRCVLAKNDDEKINQMKEQNDSGHRNV